MSSVPTERGSNRSPAKPVHRSAGNSATLSTPGSQGHAVAHSGVSRRTDQVAPSTTAAPRPKTGDATGAKPKRPATSDAAVVNWLGGSDLSDGSSVAKEKAVVPAANKHAPFAPSTSDDAILSRVAERLAERSISSFSRIGLDVKSGIVTIRGSIASKGERLLLMYILRTTPGVRTIQDGLSIAQRPSSSWKFTDLFGGLPSAPSLSLDFSGLSFDSIVESLSSIKPAHGISGLLLLLVGGFFFIPRTSSRPVAVYPLKGRVVLDGAPLAEATVVLHPTGASKLPSGVLPRGTAEADGSLTFKTFAAADGSPEGEFVATVHLMKPVMIDGEMTPGPDVAPVAYRTPETSPFRFTITRQLKEISLLELHKTIENSSPNN